MILRSVAGLKDQARAWRADNLRVGLVPTMGALHEGHLSLVRRARAMCDRVVVSIFVNPTQFDNPDDLARYPRDEARDIALLGDVDAIFIPEPGDMYPQGFASSVRAGGIAQWLEGEHRPGHFDGMATVVTKLFNMSGADDAFFGEKDWQQLQIVRQIVADLDLAVSIEACPTWREADGLAMSSRNRRLSADARRRAAALHAAMMAAAAAIGADGDVDAACAGIRAALSEARFGPIDYAEVRDARTLAPASEKAAPQRLLVAAWLEGVRLIDNIAV